MSTSLHAHVSSLGALLGAIFQCHLKGTNSEPETCGGVHDAFAHLDGIPLCFCRKADASEVLG
jgi:hypothetical protein